MPWNEIADLRTRTTKTWRDSNEPACHVRHHILNTVLHYPTAGPDSESLDGEVDFTFQHVTVGGRDLYRTSVADWHYAIGRDIEGIFANVDGTVGFGGRQGQHWFKFRLTRVGYLHWPTRALDDIGGAPTYDRANLTYNQDELTIGPDGSQALLTVASNATWSNIWQTPGGGALNISWRIDGRHLKEEITVNQAAREWIATNSPPTTPPPETWFGFVFRLDTSDIPRWVKAGIVQNIDGDFDDQDSNIEIRDALDRLLGFMPTSYAFSETYGSEQEQQDIIQLRKRIWLDGDGNHYLLVGARVDQLNAMHEGAITFDPTWDSRTEGYEAADTSLYSANPDKSYGSEAVLYLDLNATIIMEFDCSAIPGDATCDTATLSVWIAAAKTSNRSITVYELLAANADWVEGATQDPAAAGQSTWDHKNDWNGGGGGDVNWAGSAGAATADTDYDSTAIGTGNYTANDPAGTEVQASLTAAAVQDWFGDPNENYGMRIYTSSNFPRSDSSESATAAERPKLVIEYTAAGGALPMAMHHYQMRRA